MASFIKRSFIALLILGLIATTSFVVAQEAAEVELPAIDANESTTLDSVVEALEEAVSEAESSATEEPAEELAESTQDTSDSASSDSEGPSSGSTEPGTETSDTSTEETAGDSTSEESPVDEEPSTEQATEEEAPVDDAAEETVADDEPAVEEEGAEEAGYDYGALIARSPDFFAVMHPAVIHFPIALWVLGALFVVIGLFVPTWRQQIPITCLLIGTAGAIVASITGWWYADLQGYAEWNEIEWEDTLCRHRWIGVAMSIVALFVSLLALYSAKAESWFGGFLWRTGLILLALVACFEGHIGGELIHSTSIEEAFVEWINPSE